MREAISSFAPFCPAGWNLVRINQLGPDNWVPVDQTWLFAEPGITNDLGKVIFDTPPPLPVTEQIKQKMGL